jgi:hypothetical protein
VSEEAPSDRFDDVVRRTLFMPVAAVRPYLVLKGTLLVLAFDLWLTRIEQGGRYGVGGFNVAHFSFLDAIQPQITAGLYLALIIFTGFSCFALALAPRPPRWLIGLTLVLHTWSWSMSMLDSYQHHYLLTLVLLALVFFPRATIDEVLQSPEAEPERKEERKKKGPGRPWSDLVAPAAHTSSWAYVALSLIIAVVYGYTAFSKSAHEWLSGAAFRRLLSLTPEGLPPPDHTDPISFPRWLAGLFGIEGEHFWWLMGHSVVLVQIVCCAGYLLAPFRDVTRRLELRIFYWIALATALGFHVGAEIMELKIGWFSWYMIGYAIAYFLPERMLVAIARVLLGQRRANFEITTVCVVSRGAVIAIGAFAESWMIISIGVLLLLRTLLPRLKSLSEDAIARAPMAPGLVAASLGAIAMVVAGREIDLPGAPTAGLLGACALGAGTVALLVREGNARRIVPYGAAAALAGFLFWLTVSQSSVRFDFYRHVGVDHRLRGYPRTAYIAYVKANRYAPEGENRSRQEHELHDELEQQGQLPRIPE